MTGHDELAGLAARLIVPPGTLEAMAGAASFRFIAGARQAPSGT